jgi:hypothetical protein
MHAPDVVKNSLTNKGLNSEPAGGFRKKEKRAGNQPPKRQLLART